MEAFILTQKRGVQNRLTMLKGHINLKEVTHQRPPTRLAELKRYRSIEGPRNHGMPQEGHFGAQRTNIAASHPVDPEKLLRYSRTDAPRHTDLRKD
jgi:hypothetical protein